MIYHGHRGLPVFEEKQWRRSEWDGGNGLGKENWGKTLIGMWKHKQANKWTAAKSFSSAKGTVVNSWRIHRMGGKSLSAVHLPEDGCLNYTRNSNSKHQENTINVMLLHCSGKCNSFWLWTVDLTRIKHPTRRSHRSGNGKDNVSVWTPDSQKVIWSQSVHLFSGGFFFPSKFLFSSSHEERRSN